MSINSSKSLDSTIANKRAMTRILKRLFGLPHHEPANAAGLLVLTVVSALTGIAILVLLAL